MECNAAYGRSSGRAAFTLVELMVASGLGLVATAALALLTYFSSQSFAAMVNYTEMSQRTQLAMDKMTREIRQARQLRSYATNSVRFSDLNGDSLEFTYNPVSKSLVRVSGGAATTLLTGCDSLQFGIYQHTVKSNSFDCYAPAYVTNARVIQVTWVCSRSLRGARANSENRQSFKIALRNY